MHPTVWILTSLSSLIFGNNRVIKFAPKLFSFVVSIGNFHFFIISEKFQFLIPIDKIFLVRFIELKKDRK